MRVAAWEYDFLPGCPPSRMSRTLRMDMTHGRPAESPLPLRERDRVRGFARQRGESLRPSNPYGRWTLRRLPAPDPSPCPSPPRGEGTLHLRRATCDARVVS